jgi:hypothetical protein
MMEATGVRPLAAGELALRLNALRSTAAYAAYLAGPHDLDAALGELEDELRELARWRGLRVSQQRCRGRLAS